jgi:hypothetical protein
MEKGQGERERDTHTQTHTFTGTARADGRGILHVLLLGAVVPRLLRVSRILTRSNRKLDVWMQPSQKAKMGRSNVWIPAQQVCTLLCHCTVCAVRMPPSRLSYFQTRAGPLETPNGERQDGEMGTYVRHEVPWTCMYIVISVHSLPAEQTHQRK